MLVPQIQVPVLSIYVGGVTQKGSTIAIIMIPIILVVSNN